MVMVNSIKPAVGPIMARIRMAGNIESNVQRVGIVSKPES